MGLETKLQSLPAIASKVEFFINWARKWSLFQYPFITASHKQAPILRRVYEQMCAPKWVVAFGACACTGGFYDNYATVQGIDKVIPVDVFIPGCPPRPEMVLDGLMKLQDLIQKEKLDEHLRHPKYKSMMP
jgi:NADH:ubiquinone oxidoreductase subunit B-like Fe-S oxidoreductase